MSADIARFRYSRSEPQGAYEYKDTESWGRFVRYIELGDDGYATRQVDEYENGYLSRYDRTHWDDQFGTLANFRFGEAWIRHWGTPIAITQVEFEDKWRRAGSSPAMAVKRSLSEAPPPWVKA
jgi:hypothetical protein